MTEGEISKAQLLRDKKELHKRIKELEELEVKWKSAEKKVEESEKKYQKLIENIKDTIVEIDSFGNFTYISPQVVGKSGYTPEEMMKINAFELIHPDDLERVLEKMELAVKEKTMVSVEYRTKHKKGHYYPVSALGSLVQNGEDLIYIGTVRDITDQKKAENKIIEERNRAEFYLDLLSHDINNYNQAIISAAELFLTKSVTDSKNRRYVELVLEQALSISNLISNVRKLSEIRSRKEVLQDIDVSKILNSAIDRMNAIYSDRDIVITRSMPEKEVLIKGNAFVQDIFDNIVLNAVKHNRNEKINLEISASEADDGKFWQLMFEDNGPGVPDQFKNSIFKRFERGDSGLHGSGLGLTIAHEIIGQCGGKIWVEDRVEGEPTKGCRFIMKLPKA